MPVSIACVVLLCTLLLLLLHPVVACNKVCEAVKQHYCIMLIAIRHKAKEEEEDIIGPGAVADGHLLTCPAFCTQKRSQH